MYNILQGVCVCLYSAYYCSMNYCNELCCYCQVITVTHELL